MASSGCYLRCNPHPLSAILPRYVADGRWHYMVKTANSVGGAPTENQQETKMQSTTIGKQGRLSLYGYNFMAVAPWEELRRGQRRRPWLGLSFGWGAPKINSLTLIFDFDAYGRRRGGGGHGCYVVGYVCLCSDVSAISTTSNHIQPH